MNDFELEKYIKELGLQIEASKQKFEGVYILNPEKYRRFRTVYRFMCKFAAENDGRVRYVDTRPASVHADISIEVPIVDLFKDSLEDFRRTLTEIDVFGISPTTTNKLLIDASVNYLWEAVPKDE